MSDDLFQSIPPGIIGAQDAENQAQVEIRMIPIWQTIIFLSQQSFEQR